MKVLNTNFDESIKNEVDSLLLVLKLIKNNFKIPDHKAELNIKIIKSVFPHSTLEVKNYLPSEKEKIDEPDIEGYSIYNIDFNGDNFNLKICLLNSNDQERIGTYDWKNKNSCEIFLSNYPLLVSSLVEVRRKSIEYIPNYVYKLINIKKRFKTLKLIESL